VKAAISEIMSGPSKRHSKKTSIENIPRIVDVNE